MPLEHVDLAFLDATDPALEEWVEVVNASMREEWGALANRNTVEEMRGMGEGSVVQPAFLAVRVRGRMVAAGLVEVPYSYEETVGSFVMVRVLRTAQGRGIGQLLLHAAERKAAEMGAEVLWGVASAPTYRDDRTTRILRRAGWTETDLVVRMDRPMSTTPVAPDFPVPRGYRLTTCVNSVTDEVADAMGALNAAWSLRLDIQATQATSEGVRTMLEHYVAMGQTTSIVLALTEEGTLVGSVVSHSAGCERLVEQSDVVLHGDHARDDLRRAMLARLIDLTKESLPCEGRMRAFPPPECQETIEAYRAVGYEDSGFYRDWEKRL